MRTYEIKKHGYTLGQAKGKKLAIQHLVRELAFHGWSHLAKWDKIAGVIRVKVSNDMNTDILLRRLSNE